MGGRLAEIGPPTGGNDRLQATSGRHPSEGGRGGWGRGGGFSVRDWALITGRGGGGLQNGKKSRVRIFLRLPPPQDRVKLFAAPPLFFLKSGNFLHHPPFNMAKISSYHVKTTPKLVVPPFTMAKTFFRHPPPPLFFGGIKLHMPPSRFVAPSPTPLPVNTLVTSP